jgi:hypothetical protein
MGAVDKVSRGSVVTNAPSMLQRNYRTQRTACKSRSWQAVLGDNRHRQSAGTNETFLTIEE